MKLIPNKIMFLLAASVAFSACERQVEVDIPQKAPRLVINAWLQKGESIVVNIGKSRHILQARPTSGPTLESYVVKDAVPVLYENDIAIDTLLYNANTFDYKSPRNRTFGEGKTYTLRVTAPGFTMAEVTTIVPSQSVIGSITRVRNARTNGYGNELDELTVRLDDPMEKNFYLVQIYNGFSVSGGYPVYCVNTTDKDVEAMGYSDPFEPESCFDGDKILFKDDNFNGRQKILKLFIDSDQLKEYTDPYGKTFRPYIKINRVTEDYFKYLKSRNAYSNASDNPFAEPVNVYTNVKNGYGIFSAYTMAVDTLR